MIYFLGLEIAHSAKVITLNKRKYTLLWFNDTGFLGCKPASLPMDPNTKLSAQEGPLLEDAAMYRRLVGYLSYLQISRPDIIFAVNKLSQFVSQPRDTHLQVAHHLLRYLKRTPGQGLFFPSSNN